jgi:diaminopimelate epimerase
MAAMPDFAKYHALGNDYLIIDPRRAGIASSAANAVLLCDRRTGIGADGVLFGPAGPVVPGEPVGLSIFNSDGSPCARSGNGIRLFALYLADHCLPPGHGPTGFTVRTAAGDCAVEVCDQRAGMVRAGMGIPVFQPEPAAGLESGTAARPWPLDVAGRQLTVVTLDNGNPHVVVPLAEISRQLAHDLGESIAGHRHFPGRANVEFLRVASRREIDLEIWERGAGYTLASGSGACAAASAAQALGLVDDVVTVRMPGGAVEVAVAADGAVTLTGVVAAVASGQFARAFRDQLAPRVRAT